jgi:hypothetical protein
MTCTVCCDDYTDKARKPVTCLACGYEACLRCIKTFLLTTPEPNCMNCHAGWNREFLDQHLTRTWREGPLKEHRAAFLFDRERSLLPATQEAVEIELKKREYAAELEILYPQLDVLRLERDTVILRQREIRDASKAVSDKIRSLHKTIQETKWNEKDPLRAEMKMAREAKKNVVQKNKEELALRRTIEEKIDAMDELITSHRIYILDGPGESKTKERRQFVAACPSDCRGFLSTAYKCGTCQKHFCSACREPKTNGHECNPDLVATITAIVKDSRPCPACGMAISKVSGCDQMYCTSCDTAFSYQTGVIVKGVIHNPHYFERMRTLHGSVPRQPGDQACGGWPELRAFGARALPHTILTNTLAMGFYQSARHVEQVTLVTDLQVAELDNTDLRVKYLLKEIDDTEFKQKIQQRDKKRSRNLEFRGPLELYVVTVLEFFLQEPTVEKLPALVEQIRTMVNEPLAQIGKRYGNRYPQITPEGALVFTSGKA